MCYEKLRRFVGFLCLGNIENCDRLSLNTGDVDNDNDEYDDDY